MVSLSNHHQQQQSPTTIITSTITNSSLHLQLPHGSYTANYSRSINSCCRISLSFIKYTHDNQNGPNQSH